MNIAIGEAEKQRDEATLKCILANDLIFRRASGVVVDQATYLEELLKPENTYNYLCSEVVDVKLSKSQTAAIVTLHVRAKGKRGENPFEGVFRNIRFFRKEGQDWKCHVWFNEPLESLSINDITKPLSLNHLNIERQCQSCPSAIDYVKNITT